MSTPLWKPATDQAARLLGLGFATAGTAILYWQIVITLQRAAAGNPEILYSLKLIALGAMFTVLGLSWIIGGLSAYTKVVHLQQNRRFLIALGIIALIVIGLTHGFMLRHLSAYGYAL